MKKIHSNQIESTLKYSILHRTITSRSFSKYTETLKNQSTNLEAQMTESDLAKIAKIYETNKLNLQSPPIIQQEQEQEKTEKTENRENKISMPVAILIDLLVLGVFFQLWMLYNSDLINVGDQETVRVLPSQLCRKWLADQYLNIFMAKYAKSIYKITTEANQEHNPGSKTLHLTSTEINNLMRNIGQQLPGKNLNFKSLVVLDSVNQIAKYLVGEKSDTLIISKVKSFIFSIFQN